MIKLIHLFAATLPALIPFTTFWLVRQADHTVNFGRNSWDQEYDYIVVGGGSAGCVLANRLSEDPNVKVLLLEAGSSENMVTDFPIAVLNLQNTPIDWGYRTEPQEASCFGLKNRRCPWPRGKVLGGCSVLNYMMYIRGNPLDYDYWARDGCDGWSWSEVFPYFLKSEDNRDPNFAYNGYHGRGGPLTVQTSKTISPVAHAFVESGKYLGYPNIDLNGARQSGFAIPQATIRRGARCSTAKAFLYDIKGRPNLHVLTFAYVTKILFNRHKEAVAVQFDRFSLSHVVHARREIVISGGSVNTPQLLMLSGIGPKDHLKKLGIPVIANLPVGHNLYDHIYPGGLHFVIDEQHSLKDHDFKDLSYMQRKIQKPINFVRYFADGSGPLASTGGLEGLGFISTKYANKSLDYPDFEIHLVCACLSSDDGRIFRHNVAITDEIWEKVYFPYVNRDCFSLFPVLLRPKSYGYIKLRTANPYDPPVIEPRYLTHPHDIKSMVEAMKITIKVGQAPPLRKLGAKLIDKVVPGCEGYKLYSDKYLACLARTLTHTIYHPIGTCKMGAIGDPTAVVDPQLRVMGGVKRLRVADASIIPRLITGNTNAPIIMIAEKLADMLKGMLMMIMFFKWKDSILFLTNIGV
ncbi:glucose dehydrogenase [FAD, quinone]-like [Oppia nitens]|uniref:glucose dehydrogenase [FAD, quinone]-like n=1 Tax=Oppia nitens TaxID=1686743 RepID=UPI0023DBA2CC|nr:glucose dehydrogenase [FAD, quinone]-like [Oppia nitens]